jgi:RHS repeat-associated protein
VHAATSSLTYDANGNLVTGDGKYRVYNNQNQLITLYNGSNTSGIILQKFAYHPTEERILSKKTYSTNGSLVETVIYVSADFGQIINNSGTYNYTYIQANGQQIGQILPDGKKQFILGNIEGSSTVTTNSTGGVVERTSYTPYGGVISGGLSSRFNYEARENDQIAGDTDFRFRKYQPEWGIFTQPDSIIQDIYDPQGLNRYSFEDNTPYNRQDPTGHCPWCIAATAGFVYSSFEYMLTHDGSGGSNVLNTYEAGLAGAVSWGAATTGYVGAALGGITGSVINRHVERKPLWNNDAKWDYGISAFSNIAAYGFGKDFLPNPNVGNVKNWFSTNSGLQYITNQFLENAFGNIFQGGASLVANDIISKNDKFVFTSKSSGHRSSGTFSTGQLSDLNEGKVVNSGGSSYSITEIGGEKYLLTVTVKR